LKLKNDLLCLFSLMYLVRFIITNKNVGFWIFILWWIRENVYRWWDFNFILNENVTFYNAQIARTFTMFLLVWWIFLSLDFKYCKCSLVMHFKVLQRCFSISNCLMFMHSTSSKNILMFLSKVSKIRDNTFDLLCLILVFSSANGVLSLFINVAGVAIDEEFMIIILGWPWEDLE